MHNTTLSITLIKKTYLKVKWVENKSMVEKGWKIYESGK